MQQVTVRVPASTSNLGPGYDCLGVALRLYNTITVIRGKLHRPSPSHPPIVSDAAKRFFQQTTRRPFPFSCSIVERIPRCRGLGSSATVRLGVLVALNRLIGEPFDQLSLFKLCAELEGHPDNAAPASFGGFTVVGLPHRDDRAPQGTVPRVQRFGVSSRLYFVLVVPELEIQTSKARRVLPKEVPRVAAVENSANACAITAAFASRDYEKMRGSFSDDLHQPFRAKLIQFLPRVIAAAERTGALGAFLSGSGSAIAAIALNAPKKVAAAMLRAASAPARTIITHADNAGAQICGHRSLFIDD